MPQDAKTPRNGAVRHNGREGRGRHPAPYDVLIVGGGPAGLSAALVLGRCRRRVLVIDAGHPRNASAERMHGFLTRDGTEPAQILKLGREEIIRYVVEFKAAEATGGTCLGEGRGFEIQCDDGTR